MEVWQTSWSAYPHRKDERKQIKRNLWWRWRPNIICNNLEPGTPVAHLTYSRNRNHSASENRRKLSTSIARWRNTSWADRKLPISIGQRKLPTSSGHRKLSNSSDSGRRKLQTSSGRWRSTSWRDRVILSMSDKL